MFEGYKKFPSEYELTHVTWKGIDYDKDKLIDFVERYNFLKKNKKKEDAKAELDILDKIAHSHGIKKLNKLLSNDESYSRWALIEKLARKATSEVLIQGKYSKETFEVISNLPIADYKLIIRRSKDLIKIINETIAEAEMDTSIIPGVK